MLVKFTPGTVFPKQLWNTSAFSLCQIHGQDISGDGELKGNKRDILIDRLRDIKYEIVPFSGIILISFPIWHGDSTLTHLSKQGINFLSCGGKNSYSFFSFLLQQLHQYLILHILVVSCWFKSMLIRCGAQKYRQVLCIELYSWLIKMSQWEHVLNSDIVNYTDGLLTASDEFWIWVWVILT